MNQPDWDARYSESEFAYGTEPNSFLVQHLDLLQDPILSVAEGEGRNAIFLAANGLTVHGVDRSMVGLAKAKALAEARGVTITTEVVDLLVYQPSNNAYGSVVSIFAHVPSAVRQRLFPLLERSLIKGGVIILEAYSENQLGRGTGGPPDLDLLMSESKIKREFPNCETLLLHEIEREVVEGKFHTGLASVVQFIGRKVT